MVTACFDKIGNNVKFDLTEIIPSGYDKESGTIGEIFLDILNNDGTTETQYMWLDSPGDFDPGWYFDYAPIAEGDCTIEAGDGLWMTAIDGYVFTSAGQVIEKGRGIALRDGAIAAGNFLARSVDLTELTISGYDKASGTIGEVFLDILQNDGTTLVQYMWLDSEGDFEPGWYLDYAPVSEGDQTFAPSAGMWVTALDGYVLEFPDL